jgi:ATP-dependent helicase/nuclease subunit A
LATKDAIDRSVLGEAIHACIAADLATPGQPIRVDEVESILKRMGVNEAIDPAALGQVCAIRIWLQTRWPGIEPIVEFPMVQALGNGQLVSGRTDLLLRTATGWVVIDHKSTPQGSAAWEDIAHTHAGQLAAYKAVFEAVSDVSVEETWLMLPVAGAGLKVKLQCGP